MKNSTRVFIETLAAESAMLMFALKEADKYWSTEESPPTTVLADFAARLVEASKSQIGPETERALHVVETAMGSEDYDVVTAAATGFIEGLTASARKHGVLAAFLAALGPRSRRHADAWLAFEG